MDSGNGSQPPVAGLLLVALLLGSAFFIEPPLQGSRPKNPPNVSDLSSGEQTIPARLWQDPFEAIALNHRTSKSPAYKSDVKPAPFRCQESITNVLNLDKSNKGKGVLLVMTPGNPYVEDGERRIRARYAVLSALGVAGLSPQDSQHISCAHVTHESGDFDIPYEWFDTQDRGEASEKSNSVLVAWLPEEKFSSTPLSRLNRLVAQIKDSRIETSIAVIGPQNSGTLDRMRSELLRPSAEVKKLFPKLQDVRFYSPSATTDEMFFSKASENENRPVAELLQDKLSSGGNRFFKTILSDTEVSKALIDELERRGLEFNPHDRSSIIKDVWFNFTEPVFQSGEHCDVFKGHRDHLVLISELDTLYGRSFPESFINVARDSDTNPDSGTRNCSQDDKPQWIHRFSYLRGLDGQVPAKVQGQSSTVNSTTKSAGTPNGNEDLSSIKRASNTPRFDYLRRLASRMEQLDVELRKQYCGSIKAIGVLGSDVYDKLLILQALREKFPNALFFTADMDARYLHPAEFQWTRNLIVASSHGLELDSSFVSDIPPFRDSYQTSRFLATLFALSEDPTPDQETINQKLKPVHVYEIGRTIARNLTVNPPTKKTINDFSGNISEVRTVSAVAETRLSERLSGNAGNLQILSLLDGSWSKPAENQYPENPPKSEFAAVEPVPEFLKIHDLNVTQRFDPLRSSRFPGWFNITGFMLAAVLFLFGAGYYLRGYLGLHPVRFMKQFRGSLKSDAASESADLHLVSVTALLWMTLLLVALTNLVAFLLLGILIVAIILLGRMSETVRNCILNAFEYRKETLWLALIFFALAALSAIKYYEVNPLYFDHLGAGEPFSLGEGISMWPGEIVRTFAGLVAIGYMVAGWRSLKEGDQKLTDKFFPSTKNGPDDHDKQCARARRIDWCCGKDSDYLNSECRTPLDARTNWLHYRFYRSLSERWNSVLFPATLFFLLGCVSIYWLDDFHTPYRGNFVYHFDQFVIFGFMVPSFLLLLFAVIDETSLCVGWVRRLVQEFTYQTQTSYFLSSSHDKPELRSVPDRDLEEIWTRLQVVAKRTRRVGKLIVGPFVVLFLVLISQSPYFDNWDMPAGLIFTIMISATYALLCAIKLRRVTEEARQEAIRELTRQLIQRGGKDDKIEFLLNEVKQIQEGGFLPWIQQPWLKAMLWLLSAFGIMSSQYISLGALG